jgi:hypothetical protein
MQYKIVSVHKRVGNKKYSFAIASIDGDWYTTEINVGDDLTKECKTILNKHSAQFVNNDVLFEKFNDAIGAIDELNARELLNELKNNV